MGSGVRATFTARVSPVHHIPAVSSFYVEMASSVHAEPHFPSPAAPMGPIDSICSVFIPNFNPKCLSGQSAGAIRRRTSAKNRMENLFSKFDEKVHETIVKLFMLECDWPTVPIKSLARDSPHTFSLSSLEGKF